MRLRLAATFESLAALALLVMMMLTVADVVLRTINPAWRIYGIVEMVQLGFDLVVFLAVPAVFLLSSNLVMTMFDGRLGPRRLRQLRRATAVVTAGFMVVLLWQTVIPGLDSLRYRDETQDLGWPIFAYWLPIWVGLGGALIGALWSVLQPDPPARTQAHPEH